MDIRVAGRGDVGEIVELNGALFREDAGSRDASMNLSWPEEEGREYFSTLIADGECVCFLAETEDEVVGYLAGRMKRGSSLRPVDGADLESMYVRRERRGSGCGARLAEEFFRWAKEKGADKVSVTAYSANERARNFYERMGFHSMHVSLEKSI